MLRVWDLRNSDVFHPAVELAAPVGQVLVLCHQERTSALGNCRRQLDHGFIALFERGNVIRQVDAHDERDAYGNYCDRQHMSDASITRPGVGILWVASGVHNVHHSSN